MHVHIVGIAGAMTTPLALELQRLGHQVTGSDQDKIYPPSGPLLENHHIPINTTPIDKSIDLAIIGTTYNTFQKCRDEFSLIKSLKIPYISSTEYLAKNIIKKESILIAGSYGKTTISALVSWILIQASKQPTYFFGGEAINEFPSLTISDSDWSVVEADESINGLDTQAKFLSYPVKYLILTSAAWEHKDSYHSFDDNFQAFLKLVRKLPTDGLLIYNQNDYDAAKLAQYSPAPSVAYDNILTFDSPLIGQFNQENLNAAYALCRQLQVKEDVIRTSIASFHGIKRRLEVLNKINNTLFIDDFAQSPVRIMKAIEAVHDKYPTHTIKVFFEPHASFLENQESLIDIDKAFSQASEVVIAPIKFNPSIPKDKRVTARDYLSRIGDKCQYIPDYYLIKTHFKDTLKDHDLLIHFSSGGQIGMQTFIDIIQQYSTVTNL